MNWEPVFCTIQSVLLKTCVETLLKCASMPVVGLVSDTVDLPQVQAMNMLKVLFRSTRSGSAILQFAAKGMTLAISSLASPHWAIRNAATLLYGEVMGKPLCTVYLSTVHYIMYVAVLFLYRCLSAANAGAQSGSR